MGLFPWQTGRLEPRAGGRGHGAHSTAERHDTAEVGEQKVALILGVTGIVGNYLASLLAKPDSYGGPWKVYGVARRPRPAWIPSNVEYVQVDLLDRQQTLAKLGALEDVTHVFWVTWVQGETEAENIDLNSRLLQNSIDALLPNAKNLQHIVLQTGCKQYTGPFELAGKIQPCESPFVEDVPRLPCDQFYHNQEDIVFEAVKQSGGRLTYSIHRPTIIFGFAAGNLMNLVGTLAVYALICKQEGKPLVFPGNQFTYERLFDASDAELIAEQEIWACVEPAAKNQALNSSNGDVFKWKKLWKLLADYFGMEVGEYNGNSILLDEFMKGKEDLWDQVVKKYNLEPVKLNDIGHWWFADLILNQTAENVSSMNKSKELGFLGWRDTEKSFLSVLDKMKANNLIP
jgi:nucleoside-diphosphate-sugar epimerase